ncbi:aldo/keto reductase [Pigmentiphaga soli]|uniref:Aldo/keto reductase n=1 Tax=Pigmentiphaga soli TaxID=1007095 RepID=A0ABP8HNA0_9BURK
MTIPHTRLGNSGLTVSRLALGTMTFGLQTEESVSRAILDRAAEAGVDFIDTADAYPIGGDLQTVGRTEEIVGRWLAGRRQNFIVATKAFNRVGPNRWDLGLSRKHLFDAIDGSLRRLGTDYVDLYQLHSDDRRTPLDETLEALDHIVRSGKVRYIGVSNFLAYRLARALGRADLRGLTRFISVQPRYSLLFREIERELLPLVQEEGLGVLSYNPLAGGLLTGKHRFESGPPAGTRFTLGTAATRYQERYWHERQFQTVAELQRAVAESGLPLATVAVAWVLANPAISCAIIGASKPEQLADTLAAAELKLDPELKQKLDDLTAEYRQGDAGR